MKSLFIYPQSARKSIVRGGEDDWSGSGFELRITRVIS